MGHGLTAFLGAREIVQAADAYGQYASRMRMAVDSSLEYEQAQARMAASANNTFRSINETRESFILMNPVLRQMGLSLDQSINALDTFSGLLVVNAASSERAQQAQAALAKSLQTGRVETDAWQSMLTAMPSLVRVLADSSGLAEAEIRKLGISGKLSVEMLADALVRGNSTVLQQVAEMPTTVADALTKLRNGFGEYVGRSNEALGVTATLAGAIGALGDNFDTLGNAAAVVGAAVGVHYVRAMGAATLAKVAAANQARAAAIAEAQHQVALARTAMLQAQGTMSSTALTAARQRETVATQALTAAESRLVGAASMARGAVAALGGPIGIATMLLTAGATAWAIWGNRADEAAKKAAVAADDHIQSVIDKLATLNADIERMSRKSVEVAIQSGMDSLTENAIQLDKAASQVKRLTAEIAVARDAGFSQRSIGNKEQELADANIRYQALLENEKTLQASVTVARDQAARAGVQAVKDFADANSVGATRVARERARLQAEFDKVMADAGGFNKNLPEHVAAQTALNQKLEELDKAARKAKGGLSEAEKASRDLIDAGVQLAAALDAQAAGYNADFLKKWDSLTAAYEAGRLSLDGLTAARAGLLEQQPAMKALADEEKKHAEQRQAAMVSLVDAEAQRAAALVESNERAREDIATMGMSVQQLAAYRSAKLSAAAAADEHAAAELDAAAAILEQIPAERAAAAELRKLAEAKRKAAEAGRVASGIELERGSAQAAQAATEAWLRTSEQIRGAIYDALISGGEDAADVLERSVKAMVLEVPVRMIAEWGGSMIMGVAGAALNALGLVPAAGAASPSYALGGFSGNGSSGFSMPGGGQWISSGLTTAGAALGYGSAAGSFMGSLGAGMSTFGSLSAGAGAMSAASASWSAGAYASAAGYAIGAVAPYIAAVLAIASALGAFGGGTPHAGAVVISGGRGDTVSPKSDAEVRGLYTTDSDPQGLAANQFRESDFYKRRREDVAQALTPVSESLADVLNEMVAALGGAGSYRVGLGFSADGDSKSRGRFSVIDESGNELAEFIKKFSSDAAKGMEQFVGALGPAIRDALIAAVPDMAGWQAEALRALGDNVDVDGLAAAVSQIKLIESASASAAEAIGVTADEVRALADGRTLERMADQVAAFSLAIESSQQMSLTFDALDAGAMRASTDLMALAGGLEAFAGMQSVAYAMLTPAAEQAAHAQQQVRAAFAAAGTEMPKTAAGYRDLLRAQDLLTIAGRETYVELIKLAGAFDAARAQALALAGIDTNALGQAIIGGLTGDLTRDEIAVQLESSVVDGIRRAMAGSVASEVMDLMIGEIINPAIEAMVLGGDLSKAINAAHIDAVVADITARVNAFQAVMASPEVMGALDQLRSAMGGIAGALGHASGASLGAAQAERDRTAAISSAEAALRSAYQREAAELQATASRMGDFARRLREFRESLLVGDRSPLGVDARAAAAERQFADVARRAALGDTDAMDRLQGVSEDYLDTSREAAASAEEYYRALTRVQGSLLKTEGVASRQEQIAQRQLDALTAQVSALVSINGSVLSVRDAIAALEAARREGGVADSGGSAGGGSASSSSGIGGSGGVDLGMDARLEHIWMVLDPDGWERAKGVRRFAAGGTHPGGWRIVGEYGPELEVTGPARYYSTQQTRGMFAGGDDGAIVRELAALRTDLRDLRAAAAATARHTHETRSLLARVSRNGNAMLIEEAA